MSDTLIKIAKYSSLLRLVTSVAPGAANSEIFVDSPPVPADRVGFLTALSNGHPSILTGVSIGAFICDSATMTQGSSPLQADLTLDPNKIGPFIGSDLSTLNVLGVLMSQNYVFLAPGQFLRFATFAGPTTFPAAGNFATLRLALSLIPTCEL